MFMHNLFKKKEPNYDDQQIYIIDGNECSYAAFLEAVAKKPDNLPLTVENKIVTKDEFLEAIKPQKRPQKGIKITYKSQEYAERCQKNSFF